MKTKKLTITFLGDSQYDFQSHHRGWDAHLRFEKSFRCWVLDIFNSRIPDADKAHIRNVHFVNKRQKSHPPFAEVYAELDF